jgi:hypothetical protein
MSVAGPIPALARQKIEKSSSSIVVFLMQQRRIPSFDVNLAVHLTSDPGFRGIFLSIDRPTDLLRKTLMRFEAQMDRILLMDAVGRLTGWRDSEGTADRWLMALASVDNLRWLISIMDDGAHHAAAKAMIIIDNLGTLSCYASENAIVEFLQQCRNIGGVKTLAIFDPSSNAPLFDTLKRTGLGEMVDLTTRE